MANPWARDRAATFYIGIAVAALVVVVLGFSTTYLMPMARRSFAAPWYVHVHGGAALGWVLLLIAQSRLVRRNRTPLHRRIGMAAVPLAAIIFASGVATAFWAARRDLPELGSIATSSLGGTVTGLGLYVVLVIAAIVLRRRPDWHKRLIVLATIQLLWPAFFRLRHLLPIVPRPDITLAIILAYSPILIAALRDRRRFGAVHPVWLWVGPAVVIEQSLEFVMFDRPALRQFGQWLYALLA